LPEVSHPDVLRQGHAKHWQELAGMDDAALNSLGTVHSSMAHAFENFAKMRSSRDPAETQARHLERLNQDFDRRLNVLASEATAAQEKAQARLKSIWTDFEKEAKLSTKDSAELRAVIRGMDPKMRSEFIGNAIANRDGEILGAVFNAHPSLSGLSREQHKAYRGRAMHEIAPHLGQLEKALKKASETTREAFTSLLDAAPALTAAELRKQYAQQAEAAAKARLAANA
jgi:hypothetical protein